MAGSRQHTLPRFLLKGFASRSTGKEVYAYYFRSKLDPIEANIKNIGVERNFYGSQDEPEVDDAITALESDFATLLENLRGVPSGTDITESGIVEFVVHLTARTMHLRDSIIDS